MFNRLQFSLLFMFIAILVVGLWLTVAPAVRTWLAVRRLSNNDITVDGGYFGLHVQTSGGPATYLESLGSNANPWLRRALHDKQKFAAAHVLLTKINSPSHTSSSADWNKMTITLEANGSVNFHSSQLPNLISYWRGVLEN